MRVNHLSLDLENGDRQWINDQLEISFLAKYSLRWLEGVAESMRSDYACLKQLSTMFAHFKTSDHQNQLMMECVMWYLVYLCFIDGFVNAQTAVFCTDSGVLHRQRCLESFCQSQTWQPENVTKMPKFMENHILSRHCIRRLDTFKRGWNDFMPYTMIAQLQIYFCIKI